MTVTTPRYVQLGVDFFHAGAASNDKWRNRDDGTYFAVGLIEGAADLRDALQKFAAIWESEYGRQYVHAVVTVTAACSMCQGTGHIRSKRNAYKTIACRSCRGVESTQELVKNVKYQR